MFVIKKKKRVKKEDKYKIYYSIVKTLYENDKPRHKIIKYLGTVENILEVFKKVEKKKRKRRSKRKK